MNEIMNRDLFKEGDLFYSEHEIIEMLKWVKSGKLLSVGCGGFSEIETIKKYVKFANNISFYGCDITDEGVKYAFKRGFKKSRFKKCDVRYRLPYEDNTFETILFIEVLEHLGMFENTFAEISRVMHRNGNLILTTPLLNHWRKRLNILFGRSIFCRQHYRFFFRYEIENELKKHSLYIADEIKVGNMPSKFSGHLKVLIKKESKQ